VLINGKANNDTKISPMAATPLIYYIYFEELHKLVNNTILALYELELTWDLWVCSYQDVPKH
jgi:hypothetical protein